jgi:hypothetical protein
MNNMIVKLVWSHFSSNHGVITAIAMFLANIDRVIKFFLTFESAEKIKAAIMWVANWLCSRIDKDAPAA